MTPQKMLNSGTRCAERPGAVLAPPGRTISGDPWRRLDDLGAVIPPLAGQPGHGKTASLRRQPARIADGRMDGGYTSAFELICPSCGDHPYPDYSEISARLQRLRGPSTMEAALSASRADHLRRGGRAIEETMTMLAERQ
jgi:hypothetical protein